MKCPLCQRETLVLIYDVKNIPIFQNKVYQTREAALKAKTANVSLLLCSGCSFIFNSEFDSGIMTYDADYQNEQAHSPYFQKYLNEIIDLLIKADFKSKKIIEIGCGKGYFLERLLERGFKVTGFDPAYEGINPHIIKDYFSVKYSHLSADLIILRHTLEHVQNPLSFLHNIAAALQYKGMVFIEVPSVEWIFEKMAFWDIFYEHCNYFSIENLKSIFQHATQGLLFNNQYMYLLGDLSRLRRRARPVSRMAFGDGSQKQLLKKLDLYKDFVRRHPGIMVWGAGAKGATFVNLIDPYREYISGIIDINPKKQAKYIAKTGHKIFSPESLVNVKKKDVIVMNENYIEEILNIIPDIGEKLYALGEL